MADKPIPIDNWNAIRALRDLEKKIHPGARVLMDTELANLEYEIEALECEGEHCDTDHEDLIEPEPAQRYIRAKLSRIKLGLYRDDHDGDLLTVLEEIERILR